MLFIYFGKNIFSCNQTDQSHDVFFFKGCYFLVHKTVYKIYHCRMPSKHWSPCCSINSPKPFCFLFSVADRPTIRLLQVCNSPEVKVKIEEEVVLTPFRVFVCWSTQDIDYVMDVCLTICLCL